MNKFRILLHQFLIVMVFTLLTGILLFGCSSNAHIAKFSILSKNSVALPVEKKEKVTGRDCIYILSFIPTSSGADMSKAVEDALQKGNGDVLIDGRIYHYGWWIPFIYGKACFVAEGWIGDFNDNGINKREGRNSEN